MTRRQHHLRQHFLGKRRYTVIDKLMMLTATAYPAAMIPQIYQIYSTQTATGLSLVSWVIFTVFDIISLVYGVAHRLKPLILAGILWMFIDAIMIAGIMIYS